MKLGLLNCYHWDGISDSYQAHYRDMWQAYLDPLLPSGWSFDVFEVAQGQFPEKLDVCDGWIIGGSAKSCYEQEPWILQLHDYVRQIHAQQRKLLGICFGHQLIAMALGGTVARSDRGWGVGVRAFDFEQLPSWCQPSAEPWQHATKLIFSHQDQVNEMPNHAVRLATDSFCPIQSFAIGKHVWTMQGHPEFTAEFALSRLADRETIIGKAVCDKAKASLKEPTHAPEIGRMIIQFFSA